jgi:AcrR family transcriptional regulator
MANLDTPATPVTIVNSDNKVTSTHEKARMIQPRRERLRDATIAEIKQVARRQMAEQGTAAISLRAIAREMGMTAPAIYRYFAGRDELITALILDAYNALADAVEHATASAPADDARERLRAAALRYREWALAHPIEYQLILGNPIPGYAAPAEVTMPAARRTMRVFAELAAAATGDQSAADTPALGEVAQPEALYGVLSAWAQLHGLITLEMFHHLQPIIGDAGALYRAEVEALLARQDAATSA